MTRLTQEEVARFAERGYLGPFRVLPGDVAARLGARLVDEVLPRRSWTYDHATADIPALHHQRDRHLDSPAVYRLCADAAIVGRVRSLIGPDVLLWRSDFFVQAHGAPHTKAHQDKQFSGMRAIPALAMADGSWPVNITAWVALTPMTARSGGLFVVPGSHREGVIEEKPVDRSQSIFGKGTALARTYAEHELERPVMEPGEMILFDNLLVHGSSPTETETPRVAISVRFVPASVRVNPHGTATSGHNLELSRFGSILVAGTVRESANVLRAPPRGRAALALDELAVVEEGEHA